ncbi:mucin-2-like [Clinocottus analis]|uniref:mucin-2-like n=1 Tax=Clinocottus analis TaxID=304258 RepID=UPI0035C0D321
MTCSWSEWINISKPTLGPDGGEDESIQKIIAAGHLVCSHPEEVQCRAAIYPNMPLSTVGQTVTCNKDVGFICINKEQGTEEQCFDYEIKLKCCECRRGPTTSTPSTTVSTTTTSTTTTTTTPPTPSTTVPATTSTTPTTTTTTTPPTPSTTTSTTPTTTSTTPPTPSTTVSTTTPPTPSTTVSTTTPSTTPTTTTSTTTETPTTTQPPIPTPCPEGDNMTCSWSEWINISKPTPGPDGGEDESIQKIIAAGHLVCSHPEEVQCRAAIYPNMPLSTVGQTVTCNKDVGFICINKEQGTEEQCFDYEIKLKCCECRRGPTTSTPSTTVSTTTTSTTPTTTTTTPPTPSTTVSTTTPSTTPTTTTPPTPSTTVSTTTPSTTPTTTTPSTTVSTTTPSTTPTTTTPPTPSTTVSTTTPSTTPTTTSTTPPTPSTTVSTTTPSTPSTTPSTTPTTTTSTTTETPTTTQPPIPTPCPEGDNMTCSWSEWINISKPTPGPDGGEDESIQKIIAAGHLVCSHPEEVQCRAAIYPNMPLSTVGQTVTCNKDVGFICINKEQGTEEQCFDYEIKLKCCECRRGPTTSTPSTTVSTTTTSTTTTTTTPPTPSTTVPATTSTTPTTTTTTTPPTPSTTTSTTPTTTSTTPPTPSTTVSTTTPPTPSTTVSTTTPSTTPTTTTSTTTETPTTTTTVSTTTTSTTTTTTPPTPSTTVSTTTPSTTTSTTTPPTPSTTVSTTTPSTTPTTTSTTPPTPSTTVSTTTPPTPSTTPSTTPTTTTSTTTETPTTTTTTTPPTPSTTVPATTTSTTPTTTTTTTPPTPSTTVPATTTSTTPTTTSTTPPTPSTTVSTTTPPTPSTTVSTTTPSTTPTTTTSTTTETPTTTQPPIPTPCPEGDNMTCSWSEWINISKPTPGPDGGEDESIQKIIAAGHLVCSHPEEVQCRAAIYPNMPLSTVGQTVTCNKDVGFICINKEQGTEEQCFDYEIKLKCCECRRGPTTSTPSTTVSTTTTSTTTTTTTTTPPTPSTTVSTTTPSTTPTTTTPPTPSTTAFVNGKLVSPAYQNDDFRLVTAGIDTTLVIPKIHAKITFSGLIFGIYLPFSEFGGNTQGHVFELCHKVIDVGPIIAACEFDVCHLNINHIGCTSIQTYADACAEAGANATWTEDCKVFTCDPDTLQVTSHHVSCPAQPPLSCDQEGQVKVTDTVGCCQQEKCECNVALCPPVRVCPVGYSVEVTMGVCCSNINCNITDVCLYQNHVYQVGDLVPMKPCDTCNCTAKIDPITKFHLTECHPIPCDTHCPLGYEYQAAAGQCCGKCVQTSCVVTLLNSTHTLQPGAFWTPADNPCLKFECVKISTQFITVEAKVICPLYDPKDCIPGTETVTPDGCCKACIPKGQPCNISTTTVYLESQGCHAKERVNEASSSERKVQLFCPDNTVLSYTYIHIDSCACHKTECSAAGGPSATTRRRRR